jgi:ribosome maturation factor RimP
MKKTISPTLFTVIQETVMSCGVELYDAEFKGRILRVLITKPDGVTLDTCATVSQQLSQRLDIENLIPDRYFLEVSSPGIERKLRNAKDFQEIVGNTVSVSTCSGNYVGRVLSVTETGINIKNKVGSSGKPDTEQLILYTDINHARVIVSDEELFRAKQKKNLTEAIEENDFKITDLKITEEINLPQMKHRTKK